MLLEVEVVDQIPEERIVFSHIGPAVGGGVEALATEEVVFDEFDVGVMAEGLMINVSGFSSGVRISL